MKTLMKVSIIIRESLELFVECQSRMSSTFKCILSAEDRFWYFWEKGNIIYVTFIHIYRKYHISMYFFRKIIFHFPSKEKNNIFSGKKNTDNTRKIIFQCNFFGKTIFSEHFEKENMVVQWRWFAVKVLSYMFLSISSDFMMDLL